MSHGRGKRKEFHAKRARVHDRGVARWKTDVHQRSRHRILVASSAVHGVCVIYGWSRSRISDRRDRVARSRTHAEKAAVPDGARARAFTLAKWVRQRAFGCRAHARERQRVGATRDARRRPDARATRSRGDSRGNLGASGALARAPYARCECQRSRWLCARARTRSRDVRGKRERCEISSPAPERQTHRGDVRGATRARREQIARVLST